MPAKTPSKGKKAAAPKAPKKVAAGKAAKKPSVAEDEAPAADEPDEDDDDFDLDSDDDEAPRAAAKPAAPVVKKPAAAPAAKKGQLGGEDAPAVVPARRLTPEAKARVNEMVKKGMSLGDALKAAAAWETFVAPVKDEPAKLVQGRMSGGGGGGGGAGASGGSAEPRSNFGGETEPEDLPEADDEPAAADED
jgi:hypothetical protein